MARGPLRSSWALLHDRRERALPREVEPEAVLVAVADEPDPLQRLLHLDAVRPDRRVGRPVAERVGEAHDVLAVAAAHASRTRRSTPRLGYTPSPVMNQTSPVRSWALK